MPGKLSGHLLRCSFIFIAILFVSCGSSRYVTHLSDLEAPSKYYLIKGVVDLQGKSVTLPENSVLVFQSGILKNGGLKGSNTRIHNAEGAFSNVAFSGTWIVPEISTTMLAKEDNLGLSNLLNLQNEKITNMVWVKPGDYTVNADKTRGALTLTSNTTLHIEGNLSLKPQTNKAFYNGYYLIHVRDAHNVRIEGNGGLLGDLRKSGVDGEYGHGICVINSDKVTIRGISIESCNGDGIAISRNCGDVSIDGVKIKDYYRNGISVVGGNNVAVQNVEVENGGLMSPMAAIDIEPNVGDSVGRVIISNFIARNCRVGIAGYMAEKSYVDDVNIENVAISKSQIPIDVKRMSRVTMRNVQIDSCDSIEYVIRAIDNKEFLFDNLQVEAPNCNAKYPFYINNENTEIINSRIVCPQIFSFHLKNAVFKNCIFEYDSFIWTAQHLLTKNVVAENCTFKGPLFMRPSNVIIKDSKISSHSSKSASVVFEEASVTDDSTPGVTFEGNTIQGYEKMEAIVRSSVRNSSISDNRSAAGATVRYNVVGLNVKETRNR